VSPQELLVLRICQSMSPHCRTKVFSVPTFQLCFTLPLVFLFDFILKYHTVEGITRSQLFWLKVSCSFEASIIKLSAKCELTSTKAMGLNFQLGFASNT